MNGKTGLKTPSLVLDASIGLTMRRLEMADKTPPTDPVINLIANFAHYLTDTRDKDPAKAQYFLRELWKLVMDGKVELPSLTKEHIDRCSGGGFAVHYPSDTPTVLNCFIKKAPSPEWAKQAYVFYQRYRPGTEQHKNFKMANAQEPFYYGDMTLCLTDFVNGLDLDRFLLDAHWHKNTYTSYIDAIAKRTLDDLVFCQADARDNKVMISPRPNPQAIADYLKAKTFLAVEHARQFGSVDINDEELGLLYDHALDIFDGLKLNEATIVPIIDYCPKNMGIKTGKVRPIVTEIIDEISTKPGSGKPDHKQIADKLYHWDPSTKWGPFLEDFFAFFGSYEFELFKGRPNITPLDTLYKTFLGLKYERDGKFRKWADSLDLGVWTKMDKLAKELALDRYLGEFYRKLRKSDLSLTKYPWLNERLGKPRKETPYYEAQDLFPLHISSYSNGSIEAANQIVRLDGTNGLSLLHAFERVQNNIKNSIEFFNKAYNANIPENKRTIDALYLLYISQRLKERQINYRALAAVDNPADFEKSAFSR